MRRSNSSHHICHLHIKLLLLLCSAGNVYSIGCFVCTSQAGSDVECEDSFVNLNSLMYQEPCMASLKGRDGLYPASACLKMSGHYESGENVTVRSCAVDSGSLTADTEIVRLSHCGTFYLDDRYIHGCIEVCDDVDGCNSSQPVRRNKVKMYLLMLTLMYVIS